MAHQPLDAAVIKAEIADFIQEILARKQSVETSWIVQGLMQQHLDIEGTDAPWHLRHSLDNSRTMIRGVLRKLGLEAELQGDTQLVLPGWNHLQQYYPIERNQTSHIVPIEQMSDEELIAKAAAYRADAKGCLAHADELDTYRKNRAAAA